MQPFDLDRYRTHNFALLVALVLITMLAATPAPAAATVEMWIPHGPPGGVTEIMINPLAPDLLYALTNSELYRSIDRGTTWRSILSAESSNGDLFLRLAIDPLRPAYIYAATGFSGIYYSADGGDTWSIARATGLSYIEALVVDPRDPDIVFAAVHPGAFFRSTDRGGSWQRIDQSTPYGVSALAIEPRSPSRLYIGTATGVYRSDDHGVTWSPRNTGIEQVQIESLVIDSQTPATIYVGTRTGVMRSDDSGASWQPASNGLPEQPVYELLATPQAPTTLYAATDRGIFRSTNRGESWLSCGPDILTHGLAIDPQNPTTLYAATIAGILSSADAGTSWGAADKGISSAAITNVALDPHLLDTVYASANGKLYRSRDSGGQWSTIASFDTWIETLEFDPQTPGRLYLQLSNDSSLYRSDDAGNTWQTLPLTLTSPSSLYQLTIAPTSPPTLYYLSTFPSDMLRSSDGGNTWEQWRLPLAEGRTLTLYWLRVDPQTPTILYGKGFSSAYRQPVVSGIWKSVDAGATWRLLPNAPGLPIIDPQNPTTMYTFRESLLYRSRDGGQTWEQVGTGLPVPFYTGEVAIDPRTPTTLYTASAVHGVYRSLDSGDTWSPLNDGLATLQFSGRKLFAIDPRPGGHTYVGTHGAGVYTLEAGEPPLAISSEVQQRGSGEVLLAGQAVVSGERVSIYFQITSADGGGQYATLQPATKNSSGESGTVAASAVAHGLTTGTLYEYRLVVSNEFGISMGNVQRFIVAPGRVFLPLVL